ncbi:YidC/Oxa1 family membrane protein insertase [Succinivibrio sp.]|uniref:YidC/Oxa1 family membrane protein insertase n=1 Tax=Succinivibrio sp. TaxID=2053619 RepID=UPI0025D21847|nr:YidC/Oxa1 family membrane protein insertase [Succinivibrio sp.]MBQ9219652.1 YidC/Oxa1 family membrane protein insertase [Succinivibrio sp.]
MDIIEFLVFPIQFLYFLLYSAMSQITSSEVIPLFVMSIFTFVIIIFLGKVTNKIENDEERIQSILLPQIKEIKSKYKGQERNTKITNLYKRYSYNPVFAIRSSTSILVQLPFLFGAYYFLENYASLQGTSFFFVKDISKPDGLLFGVNVLPILMFLISISNVFFQKVSPKNKLQAGVISFLFLVLLYKSPAALLIYWTSNNVLYLLKTICINKIYVISNNNNKKNNRNSYVQPILISLIIPLGLTYFIFGGYFTNYEEIGENFVLFSNEISCYILLFFLFFLTLFLIVKKFFPNVFLFMEIATISFFLYLVIHSITVSNFVNVLDGREFSFKYKIISITIAFLSLLSFFAIFYFKRFINKQIVPITVFIVLGIIISFDSDSYKIFNNILKETKTTNEQYICDLEEALTFSKEKNVIIVLSDTFSGTIAKKIMQEQEYAEMFEGFTLLDDYSCIFPTTAPSVGALLSSEVYDNRIPLKEFYKKTEAQSIPYLLKHEGYDSYLYGGMFIHYPSEETYNNVKKVRQTALNKQTYAHFIDLGKYKFVPFIPYKIKLLFGSVYNKIKRLFGAISNVDISVFETKNTWDFKFIDLIQNKFKVSNNDFGFNYIHLRGAHPAYNVNSEFEIGSTSEIEQSKASLKSISMLIQKLKKENLFDNALIVITADHPDVSYKEKSILGLIHFPNQLGKMKHNETPLSIIDIKKIVLDVINSAYKPVDLNKYTNNNRIFNLYEWDDGWAKLYLPVFEEYTIKGVSYKKENYEKNGITYYPNNTIFKENSYYKFPRDFIKVKDIFENTFININNNITATRNNVTEYGHNYITLVVEAQKTQKIIVKLGYKEPLSIFNTSGSEFVEKSLEKECQKKCYIQFNLPYKSVVEYISTR